MKNGLILTALVVLIAAACGDSSSNKAPAPAPVVIPEVVVFGPITGFGSVIVNGVEFNTDSATVTMDDQPGTPAELRIGMMVSIRGTMDPATGAANAGEIDFFDNAEGPVSGIDHAAGYFFMLGQKVFVDELTMFENATFENLAAGHVVQVSGLVRNREQIQATHVYRIANEYAAGMTMEVKGEIEDLDIGNHQFRIGAQSCNYSESSLELGGADIANGMYVEASSVVPIDGEQMMLNRVQVREQQRHRYELCETDCTFEIVGYVTFFVSETEFEVNGQPVTTTQDTVYVNGTMASLGLDVRVAINGTLNDDGILVAEQIVFRLPSVVEIKADVESLDTMGALTVLGIPVQTNEFTVFHDHTTSGTRDFGFDDLVVADRVNIRAYTDGSSVVASRLEREDPGSEVTLKALVDSIDQPSIVLLGVTVTSDLNTVFQNAAHIEIDADEFFDLVDLDSIVRTEGTYYGTSITASKMFLRECVNNCL